MQATKKVTEAWEQVRGNLCSSVGKTVFDRWLINLQCISFVHGVLKIGAPNRFILEWVESRYMNEIERAVGSVLGNHVTISLVISGPLFQQQRRRHAKLSERKTSEDREKEPYRDHMSLETFVHSRSNSMAYRAALNVINEKKAGFNPLVIFGDSGIGKTHLLKGFSEKFKKVNPRLKSHYIASEGFSSAFRSSIQRKKIKNFRKFYRSLDLLVIDDFHALTKKTKTQIEFLHTFDSLANQGKSVVVASSEHPGAINGLQYSLRQRLMGGLIIRLQQPDLGSRKQIVENGMRRMKQTLGGSVVSFLAEKFTTNVRDLVGAATRLGAYASLEGRKITVPEARILLSDYLAEHEQQHGSLQNKIIDVVCRQYAVTEQEMCSYSRKRTVTRARKLAVYLLRRHMDFSLREIGDLMGGRKAPTIRAAVRDIENELASGGRFMELFERVTSQLGLSE